MFQNMEKKQGVRSDIQLGITGDTKLNTIRKLGFTHPGVAEFLQFCAFW